MTYVHVALKTLKLVSNTQMHDAWQRANFLVVHTSTDTLTLLKSYKALSQHIPIYIAKSLGVFFFLFFFMDTTCGTGSAYLFWAHATTHVFYGVRVAQSLNSYVVFYALLLLLWLFFVGFFFAISLSVRFQIMRLIIPLVYFASHLAKTPHTRGGRSHFCSYIPNQTMFELSGSSVWTFVYGHLLSF